MISPASPFDEAKRLASLHALDILDSGAEERFDGLTRLAQRIFGVPIALVTLVDTNRQWFKSCQGLEVSETTRDISFCSHAILGDDIMVVNDATLDERFFDNPLVLCEPKIRFYAGCPLVMRDGSKAGTLCIIDQKARDFDDHDAAALRDLARIAERELEVNQLTTVDELTQLSNRRGFVTLGSQTLQQCDRAGQASTLLSIGIDDFKSLKGRFGHAEGDYARASFAALLLKVFRESDVIGRLADTRFAVLLAHCTEDSAQLALRKLQRALHAHNHRTLRGYPIRHSAGAVTRAAGQPMTLDEMLIEGEHVLNQNTSHRLADEAEATTGWPTRASATRAAAEVA